jgi:hypothetical protein
MTTSQSGCPIERLFSPYDVDRIDEFGFLDPARTPKLVHFDALLQQTFTWVLGPPWLGKSKVANDAYDWLRTDAAPLPGLGERIAITKFGQPSAERDVPPSWWHEWLTATQLGPAVWLLDGVDEGLDRNCHLFDMCLRTIESAPAERLRDLRLIVFSRPYAEIGDFKSQLERNFPSTRNPSAFWLARLDRDAAEAIVGADLFPAVCDLIQRNDLQTVAGFPIVLRFLKKYGKEPGLRVRDVWRGVLTALLGERSTNPSLTLTTTPEERFKAACRIAGVLALTGRDTIREYSPNPAEPTLGMLFTSPDNLRLKASQEVLSTAAMVMQPEQGAYRFAQRNVRDWLVTFALEPLPVHTLRSALSGDDGQVAPGLRESARLLRAITDTPLKREAIDALFGGVTLPSDATTPTLALASASLDQLEELAETSPWGLRGNYDPSNSLGRLRAEGLGALLASRLRDSGRSSKVKELLIDVAEATRALEAVDAAIEITLDTAQDAGLRLGAMALVIQLGGDSHFKQLESPIGEVDSLADIDSRLRGMFILTMVRRRLWPLWRAALHAPPEDDHVVDSRALLIREMNEAITLDDARQIIPHLRILYDRHHDYESRELPEFLERTIELVAREADAELVKVIVAFVFDLINSAPERDAGAALRVATMLRENAGARRAFYEHDLRRSKDTARKIGAFCLIQPDDYAWLRDMALGDWAGTTAVWEDAYLMARKVRDSGTFPAAEWEEFVAVVEGQAPGLIALWEEKIARYAADQQRREIENRRRAAKVAPVPLDDQVRTILGSAGTDATERMRELAWTCFATSFRREDEVSGEWSDLSPDLQSQVLQACRAGLDAGPPTTLRADGTLTKKIISEAAAFSRILLSPDPSTTPLSEALIRRWLPTALATALSSGWVEVIRASWAISPSATEEALLKCFGDQIQRYAKPFVLRDIPHECWTDAMTKVVIQFISDEQVNPHTRRDLLEQIAERGVPECTPIASAWSLRTKSDDTTGELRKGARNVLLHRDPGAVIALLEAEDETRRVGALEELQVLWAWHDEFHVEWRKWPTGLLERLGSLCVMAFPLANDPEYRGGFVTPTQEVRRIRNELVNELLGRADAESDAALDRLSGLDTRLRDWVTTRRLTEKAAEVLRHTATGSDGDHGTSLEEAVNLLDKRDFRLVRTEDDLCDAVMETLAQINLDIGHDLPMLFSAPDRSATRQARKHLEEDALQSYLRRRLLERLPRIVDGVEIEILREDEVARRQRFDLRIIAPAHGASRSVQVVVEIKWSDNDETRSSLTEQLGERYLRGERLTHGVYLVGWCGEWTPGDGSGKSVDIDHLRAELTKQRDNYCGSSQPGAALRIEPMVLDIRWKTR